MLPSIQPPTIIGKINIAARLRAGHFCVTHRADVFPVDSDYIRQIGEAWVISSVTLLGQRSMPCANSQPGKPRSTTSRRGLKKIPAPARYPPSKIRRKLWWGRIHLLMLSRNKITIVHGPSERSSAQTGCSPPEGSFPLPGVSQSGQCRHVPLPETPRGRRHDS